MTISWNTTVPPTTDKHSKYRQSSKGRALGAKRYLARGFVAYDGEGVTVAQDHLYVMLAAMNDTDKEYVAHVDVNGLSTRDCLNFFLDNSVKNSIHVVYGGSYDFNMILKDLTKAELTYIYKSGSLVWRHAYRLAWRRGKSFHIKRMSDGKAVTIYDILPFFQTSFVKACDSFLGDDFVKRDMIVENKALRSAFTMQDVDQVAEYNEAELLNLLALIATLRERLESVNLRPTRWDGPGAVAAALLKRENIKEMQAVCPPAVAQAGRYAYAGGRFELLKFGSVDAPVYEYDVNSAYPTALQTVPNLNGGTWRNVREPVRDFAVCRIKWKANTKRLPGPLFRRNPNGTICYPYQGEGWYWKPEYDAALAYQAAGHGAIELVDCWEYEPRDDRKPFAFIPEMYAQRKIYKAAGDGAHVALKLALNSLYGKLAQQIGAYYDPRSMTWFKPPYHQLEWAGYTTSFCRAKVLTAALQDLDSVIAFETDALFTTRPLDLPVNTDLGGWEMTEFKSLTYLQSGFYFGTLADGKSIQRTRGVDRGELTLDKVLPKLSALKAEDRTVDAKLSRFVGAGLAIHQDINKWRKWETVPKKLNLEPRGKRIHHPRCVKDGVPLITLGEWHETICPITDFRMSAEYPLMWENPDPNMDIKHLLRELEEEIMLENGW